MQEGNKNKEKAGKRKKGIEWALWLYGFMEMLQKYFYCIETANSANFPKKEKLLCSNKFCREKLFIYNCEWKFIANSGLVLFSRNNMVCFGNEQRSAQTARSSIGQGESLELCSNARKK